MSVLPVVHVIRGLGAPSSLHPVGLQRRWLGGHPTHHYRCLNTRPPVSPHVHCTPHGGGQHIPALPAPLCLRRRTLPRPSRLLTLRFSCSNRDGREVPYPGANSARCEGPVLVTAVQLVTGQPRSALQTRHA